MLNPRHVEDFGTFRLRLSSYCGMSGPADEGDMGDLRRLAARRIRRARRAGYPVATLRQGRSWEILEPEDCAMVPDACGVLSLSGPVVYGECRECGYELLTRDACDCLAPIEEDA